MEQVITLLQKIAQTAYKTQETVKTLASYPEATGFSHITQLGMLLDEIKINSIRSAFEIIEDTDPIELRDSFNIIFENIKAVNGIHAGLNDSLTLTLPRNLAEHLDKNIQSLNDLFKELAPHMERIYGRNSV